MNDGNKEVGNYVIKLAKNARGNSAKKNFEISGESNIEDDAALLEVGAL